MVESSMDAVDNVVVVVIMADWSLMARVGAGWVVSYIYTYNQVYTL